MALHLVRVDAVGLRAGDELVGVAMSVYVDKSRNPYRGMLMSHMIADTIDELHGMAERLGLRRSWFQGKASSPHYDICQEKRAQAVRLGAVELERNAFVEVIRRLRALKSESEEGS